MQQDILIKASNLRQEFKTGDEIIVPLKSASFNIMSNSFNIIFGPSGSGKSTLLNILTGLQRPSSGQVLFGDRDVYGLKPDELAHFRANRVGIVYQSNYWVKSLNVLENVSMPLYFLGYSRATAAKIAYQALEQVQMAGYAKKYPLFLSGGEQQRIAMARALVNDPLFVIADEPTGNLDSNNGDMIMSILRKSQTDLKRTVILVTHNMEYLPLADQLLHIEDGELDLMANDSVENTTNSLIDDMKRRIQDLARSKQNARA